MSRLVLAAIAALAVAFCWPLTASAQSASVTTEMPIIGGTRGVARALGVDPVPEAPRFIVELARLIYDAPEGKSTHGAEAIRRLSAHLDLVRKFQQALSAAQTGDGTMSLEMARQKNERNRLQSFLTLVGLKLREKKSAFSVEPTDNKDAAERVRMLNEIGIDLGQLASKLNAGEAVHVAVPVEAVPVALSAETWGGTIFERHVTTEDLFATIVSDRNAALLACGLAGMDDPTLAFLTDHPKLLRRLYAHDAAAVATFGDSLHVRNGRLLLPGGDAATDLWRAAVDEQPDRPEQFVAELFGRSNGRIAYLFDLVAHLTPAQRAFVLGAGVANAATRIDRFKTLAGVVAAAYETWNVNERPFTRVPHDLALFCTRLDVDAHGLPRAPAARVFWAKVFETTDLPDEAAKPLRKLHEDGDIDAAWLAEQLTGTVAERARRFNQFMFGQRVFAGVDEAGLPDALVALRGYPRFPTLLLTLDRAGVRAPAVFAAAVRHAGRLGALDPPRAFTAFSQFQGALAVVERLATAGSLPPDKVEPLTLALVSARLNGDGRYEGEVAQWMAGSLAPVIAAHPGAFESDLIAALAGIVPTPTPVQRIVWEGQGYRLDLATPEQRRLSRMRAVFTTVSLDAVLELAAVQRSLASADASLTTVQTAAATLQKVSATLPQPPSQVPMPPAVDAPKPAREALARVIQELTRIKKPQDVKKAQKSAEGLGELVDVLLGQSLRSLVYAMSVGSREGKSLTGDVCWRHDFGFGMAETDARARTPWKIPEPQVETGTPWHVRGSLLGLDIGLGAMSLTRIATDAPARAPVLTDAARQHFIASFVLMNARLLRDADRDAIADAVGRGKAKLTEALSTSDADPLDQIAGQIDLDGWRRSVVQWTWRQHGDVASYFSLSELAALGGLPEGSQLDAWGVSAIDPANCQCIRAVPRPQWHMSAGRREIALEPAQVSDLQLRIAIALHELKLPAQLARGVLSAALSDYLDAVHPADEDDWLTLVRAAQSMTTERIQDYVAALTVAGPLLPDSDKEAPDVR